ncbi:MAG: malto-oligosyltrehalose synthase [Candidatus Omnitrophota bacterium]
MIPPRATYRIQLTPSFGFDDGVKIGPYLACLGISHFYSSPVFMSVPGSSHGYDVVDPRRINPELGGIEGLLRLSETLSKNGMKMMQDIVPNHMAYHSANTMLMDIFEKRERSKYFGYFDIDWVHPFENFQGRVLAPFLGRFYSECLKDGEIRFTFEEDGLFAGYYEHRFPLYISTYKLVLLRNIHELEEKLHKNHPVVIKYYGIARLFESIYSGNCQDVDLDPQLDHAKKLLWQAYSENELIKTHVDNILKYLNGDTADPEFYYAADDILSRQCFRLAFWKVASEELNYRRFFTVNGLISLRVEKREVMKHTHSLILELFREGIFNSLRIDHVDGLYDPNMYLEMLRKELPNAHIVVEKILRDGELLPEKWPIEGTTGYDFLSYANRVFCDKGNEADITRIYHKFTGLSSSYESIVRDKRRLIIGKHMAGDIDNLAYLMKKVSGRNMYGRDITLYGLKRALVEVLTFFPVYRTYCTQDYMSAADSAYIENAIDSASMTAKGFDYEFEFIKKFFSREFNEELDDKESEDFRHFIMRFQQLSAPIMAKGFEDTVFYNYNRLISLNEVGGDPWNFGIEPGDFHEFNIRRAQESPGTMNATSTHDTKRGEDVRARISVISEMPAEWEERLSLWKSENSRFKTFVEGLACPDPNDEYFIYQSLLGSFPFTRDEEVSYIGRMKEYIIKVVREAKVHTAWVKPDTDYENACVDFIEKILSDDGSDVFRRDFTAFRKKISHYGVFNSLSQVLLKAASPGFPDIYQGTELWDLSLVDPDNRREVDFDKRAGYLDSFSRFKEKYDEAFFTDLIKNKDNGSVKLFFLWRALLLRKEYPDLFLKGEYIPLETKGEYKNCVIAFLRKMGRQICMVTVPRFITRVADENTLPLGREVWGDTAVILPFEDEVQFLDKLTLNTVESGQEMLVGDIFQTLPAGLLFAAV